MRIGSCVSKRGRITKGSFPVCKHNGKTIRMPVAIAEGKESNKKIFFSAGMHGNELNGVEILQRFMHGFNVKKLTGTIIFLPVLNTSGYSAESRYVQYDKLDLNRSFGKGKSISHVIARSVQEEVLRHCEFGVDLHDSGGDNILIPHTRVHGVTERVCKDGCTASIGSLFGTELIMDRIGRKGMFAIESYKQHNLPVLTVEIGGAMIIWEDWIPIGIRGLNNLLKHYKMIPGKLILPRKQYVMKQLDIIRKGYKAKFEGIFTLKKELGTHVSKGELVAEIHDPIHERTQEIKARHKGIVFSTKLLNKIDKDEVALTIVRASDRDVKIIDNKKKDAVLKRNSINF